MKKQNGFTLVELMIAMVIFAVVIAAIYAVYFSQQKSYVTQEEVAATQQNIRAAEIMIERDLRMAGVNDPNNPPAPLPGFEWANNDSFQISMDLNGDGFAKVADNEIVTYWYDALSHTIRRDTTVPAGSVALPAGLIIAEGVDALDFVYFDMNSNRLNNNGGALPNSVANLAQVVTVQLTLVARVDLQDPKFLNRITYANQQGISILGPPNPPNDNFRRRILTLKTQCRNLWYRLV